MCCTALPLWKGCVHQYLQHTCSRPTHSGQVIAGVARAVASYCCSVLPAVITAISCSGGMWRPQLCAPLLGRCQLTSCCCHTCSPTAGQPTL
ncbi:hypothetical protein PBY51_003461 [Eleginops maclovinus]|uniref:Uncharacterized protein n=1 Tax=Eleginops maclovinus TaxID=56733 RepID=A0AAN7Y0T5_ELEMC|nr:hypothetical protein PBY51_003461 [Eleginops maclovinus]